MKKITSLLLSVLMILSVASFTVSAKEAAIEEGNELAVVIDDVVVTDTSTTVVVPVTIKFTEAATGINGAELYITYDATKLTFDRRKTSWQYGFIEDYAINSNSATNGRLALQFAFDPTYVPKPLKEEGALINIGFTVVAGATGDVEFEFDTESTLLSTLDAAGEPVAAKATLINGKVTLPAPEVEKYDVTFDANLEGVTSPDAMTDVEAGTEIDLPVLENTEDYTFLGWKVDGAGEALTGKYIVNATVTLTAAWEKIEKYDVTFVSDYGTAPNAMTDVLKGTKITLIALDNTDDFTFGGWTDDENTYAAGTEYEVTGDVTLAAVWNKIVKYTVTFSEGADPVTVVAGQSVTVPTLTKEDLVFKGWKVGETDEIVAGGAEFIPTASVLLTAQWKSAGKVYLSDNGDDTANGLTVDTPVKTIAKAMEIAAADEEINILVIVDSFTASDKANTLGVAGRTLTITGNTAEALFRIDWPKAEHSDGKDTDDIFSMAGPVVFDNIVIQGDNNDGRIKTQGHKLVMGAGVTKTAGNAANISVDVDTPNAEIELHGGEFGRVFPGKFSGGTHTGNTTITIDGDNTKVATLGLGHGWRQTQNFSGIYNAIINGGAVTTISLQSGGTGNLADNGYRGLRYYTINDGTVDKIVTTSSPVWGTVKDGANAYSNVAYREGVTVFEINKAGAVTGTIDRGINIETKEKTDDGATRIIIFNNDSYEEGKVLDTGAITVIALNGVLKAEVTVAENGYTTTFDGFSYELPEGSKANAVKVDGGETILLADFADDIITGITAAGEHTVEFVKVFKVTIGEETTLVEEGDTIALTRLPQNGDLKHIGWTTVEGSETAEIDHTSEYAPTADVTLYPVWAEAVYFTATFETNHGEAPAAISIIDDDEDGKADEAFMFPGYDGKQDEHFTFTGWMDKIHVGAPEGTVIPKYNAGDILTLDGNKTFIATWAEDPKGTVTYRNESGEAPEAVTDYVGTEIVIAECPAVEGFEFLGWIADGVTYQPGEKYTIEDEFGIAFTAKWGVKVAVDANGAKGEAPVIGGAIGEEIDLPTEVALTYVNHTFKGFALAADGEVITGKYTVNPEDTLYVIWEEVVADAAIIETKVVYNSATNDYTVDMYFYGADANTVAFGYTYGENLEFVSFAPAAGLVVTPEALEVKEDGYYAYAVTNQETGKIEGAAAEAGNGVHLGTITLAYAGTKEDYSEDDAADNIAITAPKTVVENVSSAEYFLYTPAVAGLEVIGLPVVFDEAIEYEIVDVVYTVNGSVKVVRADGTAPKNYAEIEVYNEQGNLYKTFIIEDAETTTVDGVFNYEIGLGAGKYTFVVKKTGYLAAECDVEIAVQEGAGEDGFVPTPVDVALVELTAGDVVADFGVIDLLDFAGIVQAFDRGDLEADETVALDINEDGVVGVDDLKFVKDNFGAKAE